MPDALGHALVIYFSCPSRVTVMKRPKAVIVISTFSDEESATGVAKKMLDARLCACVNVTKVRSFYSWEGKRQDHDECLALFKTTPRSSSMLKKAIRAAHPYKVPELVELAASDVSETYLAWLVAETSPDSVSKKRDNTAK